MRHAAPKIPLYQSFAALLVMATLGMLTLIAIGFLAAFLVVVAAFVTS